MPLVKCLACGNRYDTRNYGRCPYCEKAGIARGQRPGHPKNGSTDSYLGPDIDPHYDPDSDTVMKNTVPVTDTVKRDGVTEENEPFITAYGSAERQTSSDGENVTADYRRMPDMPRTKPFDEEHTLAMDMPNEDITIGMDYEDDQNAITESAYSVKLKMRPVTGWLVCVNGNERGRDYRLHDGYNYVGRYASNEVVVVDDIAIASTRHFAVIFDPESSEFFLKKGEKSVSVNGKSVSDVVKLNDSDIICAGSSDFVFIVFVKEGRKW